MFNRKRKKKLWICCIGIKKHLVWDKIGMCPNIEVGKDVTDISPFFIRPYHVREEDKKVIDKEMKHLCYLGILKEGFFAIFKPGNVNQSKINTGQESGNWL